MNAPEFESWLLSRASSLGAWGAFVVDTIKTRLEAEVGAERYASFMKVDPHCRVKSVASALKKQADKNYEDPTASMTDLVGTRFVVLLRTDIDVLDRVIIGSSSWAVTRDRTFEYEISQDPDVFDYQSVHYVVRSTEDRDIDGILVPDGTACEVQVRTLLQHAYAELVHDRIYKSDVKVPASAKRLAARSMALMETTDEMFCAVVREIEAVGAEVSDWLAMAGRCYSNISPSATHHEDSLHIVETYRDLLPAMSENSLSALIARGTRRARISSRATERPLFAHPVCVIVYWLAVHHHTALLQRWPISLYRDDVDLICGDLGFAGFV